MSPAPVGGFFTTESPRKPWNPFLALILLANKLFILLINPIFDIHYAVSDVSSVDHIMNKVLTITVSMWLALPPPDSQLGQLIVHEVEV